MDTETQTEHQPAPVTLADIARAVRDLIDNQREHNHHEHTEHHRGT